MAFMMPVMKNNYDIYKDSRSRKTSECSNASSTGPGSVGVPTSLSFGASPPSSVAAFQGRQRKVSECKSESFATSPSHSYRMQMQRCQSSRGFSRNPSRSSAGAMSPTRSFSQSSSPPKSNNGMSSNGASATRNTAGGDETPSDISKFHVRLVDKLRKSFRKDSAAKRS